MSRPDTTADPAAVEGGLELSTAYEVIRTAGDPITKMNDEVEDDEEERLREQEQLQLIEQETMLRLEEQQRLNEQSAWQMQQMMAV